MFYRPRLLTTTLAVALAATVVLTTNNQPSAAAGCANEYRTEAGTCAKPVPAEPLTPWQKEQAQKMAQLLEKAKQLRQSGRSTGLLFPGTWILPEVAKMRIYREGEGNAKKHYTCGPSAARNVLAAMYKRKIGAYKDFGEARLASWMGTTNAGTARANIARALNKHFKNLPSWSTYRPHDKDVYLAAVQVNTAVSGRSIFANVDTGPLTYFNGVDLNHFNFVYGYIDQGRPRKVLVGEEWDPKYIYGKLPKKYGKKNPYGKHKVDLDEAFRAINNDPIHGIVA